MTSPSDNDKNKDAASDAKANGGENKAYKYAAAKETLNKIIYKTGVLVRKIFAVSKAASKDVVQELRNINTVRKETVATAAEGTKKTELAKTFWTKTSGKQRGILVSICAVIIAFVYIATHEGDDWNYLTDICIIPSNVKQLKACNLKSARASENLLVTYTTFNSKYEILTIDYGSKYPTNLKRNERVIRMPATYKKMGENGLIEVKIVAPNNCTFTFLYKRDENKRIFRRKVSHEGGCAEEQRIALRTTWSEIQYISNR